MFKLFNNWGVVFLGETVFTISPLSHLLKKPSALNLKGITRKRSFYEHDKENGVRYFFSFRSMFRFSRSELRHAKVSILCFNHVQKMLPL